MMIKGLIFHFRNYKVLRYGECKPLVTTYTSKDSDNFTLDMLAGMTITAAAKKNGLPLGSAHRYVPDILKKKRDKVLARKLAKDKADGLIKITNREIAGLTNYSKDAIRIIVAKIKGGHVYED